MSKTYHVPNRALLRLTGAESAAFLQGVFTNDINALNIGGNCYALHLSAQGRILFDAIIHREGDTSFLLEIPRDTLITHAQQLHGYIVQEQLEFDDLCEDYSVLHSTETPQNLPQGAITFTDPRKPNLGHRIYWPTQTELPKLDEDYTSWRIENALPEGPQDITEKMLAAEFDADFLTAVSYQKGCYVGQELTARMHYKTTPKKRLYTVSGAFEGLNDTLILNQKGAEAGILLSHSGNTGFALLRTRYADQPLTVSGTTLKVQKLLHSKDN